MKAFYFFDALETRVKKNLSEIIFRFFNSIFYIFEYCLCTSQSKHLNLFFNFDYSPTNHKKRALYVYSVQARFFAKLAWYFCLPWTWVVSGTNLSQQWSFVVEIVMSILSIKRKVCATPIWPHKLVLNRWWLVKIVLFPRTGIQINLT